LEIKFTSEITVRPVQKMGGDWNVVAAAKVSTSGEEALKFATPESAEANAGLINYLMKMRHGTPFEHSSMTFFVHAPIFVWREWHRHRIGFSYNETSGRYSQLEPIFWIPRPERPMKPVEGFKPSRPQFEPLDLNTHTWLVQDLKEGYKDAYNRYLQRLDRGVAKEVARAGLPVGIYSSCWVTTNPRALMNFLSLRVHDPDAKFVSYPQQEIQEAARVAEHFLSEGWPLTYRSFVNNGRVGP
jgi:thymidylate synthase (FAD)